MSIRSLIFGLTAELQSRATVFIDNVAMLVVDFVNSVLNSVGLLATAGIGALAGIFKLVVTQTFGLLEAGFVVLLGELRYDEFDEGMPDEDIDLEGAKDPGTEVVKKEA